MTFNSRHRTFEADAGSLLAAGFALEDVREVTDEANPRWQRVPMFLHLRAVKERGKASQPG